MKEVTSTATRASELPVASKPHPLLLDFLAWLEAAPRTYDETMAAWRTSCPRLSVWEDALAEGFVRVDDGPGVPSGRARVEVTARGRQQVSPERPGSRHQ